MGIVNVKRNVCLFLLTVLALSACSTSFEEKLSGRWASPAEDYLIEFFHDNTVLVLSGADQTSGNWVVAGESRVKVTTFVLGTPVTILLEDVTIDGDKFSFMAAGKRGTLSRVNDPAMPLTAPDAQAKLNSKFKEALSSSCKLSQSLQYSRSFSKLQRAQFCEARLEVVTVGESIEGAAVVEAKLLVDWKPEAMAPLYQAQDLFFDELFAEWRIFARPTQLGCLYSLDAPGVWSPSSEFEDVGSCADAHMVAHAVYGRFGTAFKQALPPLRCDKVNTNLAENRKGESAKDSQFSENDLEGDCHFLSGIEERHQRSYTFAQKGFWWEVTATEDAVNFRRKWLKNAIPEGSEGSLPKACPWIPVANTECFPQTDSSCVAGDYVFSCS